MANQTFTGLGGPDDVLAKISAFVVAHGWTVIENCIPDLSIDGSGVQDGLRLIIQKNGVYAHFRSASTKKIFQSQQNAGPGIGLVCATNSSKTPPSGYWYDQANATKHKNQEVIGVGVPLQAASNLRLICNSITDPANMLVFSFEVFENVWQHLAVGETQKVGAWTGGMVYSGSRNSYNMIPSSMDATLIETTSNRLFAMAEKASTFLRIDVDAAPLRNPAVLWASAGPDDATIVSSGFTGKILGLPVIPPSLVSETWMPKIPHYGYLQSQSSVDIGRNVNTLNCISVNLPLALYIQRDPDALRNYSQLGYVPGVFCISLRNTAPTQVYEISYPQSGNLHQVFPHTRRGGNFGYDGFSIKQ